MNVLKALVVNTLYFDRRRTRSAQKKKSVEFVTIINEYFSESKVSSINDHTWCHANSNYLFRSSKSTKACCLRRDSAQNRQSCGFIVGFKYKISNRKLTHPNKWFGRDLKYCPVSGFMCRVVSGINGRSFDIKRTNNLGGGRGVKSVCIIN